QVSSGRPHMLTSNQRGRGNDPVVVLGSMRPAVAVNIGYLQGDGNKDFQTLELPLFIAETESHPRIHTSRIPLSGLECASGPRQFTVPRDKTFNGRKIGAATIRLRNS